MKASIPFLVCYSLILTACSTHQQAHTLSSLHPAPHSSHQNSDNKTVKQDQHNIENFDNLEPDFLYLAAQGALQDGQRDMAIKLLAALVRKAPNAIDAHFQLLELLIESAQKQQVEEHIHALSQQKNLSAKQTAYLQLAEIRLLAAQQQIEPALNKLNTFLKQHPVNRNARNIQAKLLASEQRYDEGIAAINAAIKIKDLPDFRLLQAQLFIKSNNFPAATTALLHMQQLAPDHDTPALMLASLALKNKKTTQAEKILRAFLHKHPDALRISQALGQLLTNDKRVVEAILVYRDAATRSANNPNILHPLGMLYFQRQDYQQAESIFRQLVAIQPNDANYFYLAASLEALQRTDEAQRIYQRIHPKSELAANAQLRLAAIDIMTDHIDSAEQRLKDILKNNSKNLDALLMISTIHLNQEKFQQLLDETENSVALPTTPAQLLFNRAVALESLKKYNQVETTLQRVIQAVPSHAEAMNFLAYTYAIQGIKLGKAEALLHRALLLKPDNGYYLDSLAWVYYKGGNYSKAASTQTQALKFTSDDAIMFEHYGDILWRHGDTNAAKEAWKKAINLKASNINALKEKILHGLNAL